MSSSVSPTDPTQRPRSGSSPELSDERIGDLLRTLPREQASIGFESRVLRRAHEQPTPRRSPFAKGVRVAAPLAVAAALGFVLGPSLSEFSGSSGTSSTVAATGELRPAPTTAVPNRARIVSGTGGLASGSVVDPGGVTRPRLEGPRAAQLRAIRAETERVRRQLDDLRRTHSAASAMVTIPLDNGVEVQVDLRELLLVLEERQRLLAEQGSDVAPQAVTQPPASSMPEGQEPPQW